MFATGSIRWNACSIALRGAVKTFDAPLCAGIVCALLATGCDSLIGLKEFSISSEPPQQAEPQCERHADCSDGPANFCLRATHRCVALASPDCKDVSGQLDADNAIVLGAMVAFAGPQSGINRARLQSMQLAVDELNALGGVPLQPGAAPSHPLVLVACDEEINAERAARHLTEDLHVAAILGPTGSQTSLDVTTRVTIPANTLTLSPTAQAESLAELSDNDMSWLMVPTDAQRGALLIHEISAIERALRKERARDIKLGVVFQDDAIGVGTRSALVNLTWNGESLSLASNLGAAVKLGSYDPGRTTQVELVETFANFAPDLLVLVGGNSIVQDVMAPLEAAWLSGLRPEYLLIDSAKGPGLLQLVAATPALRARVRGTGVSPSPASEPVYRNFLVDYESHYPGDMLAASAGVGQSYDAVYALAIAMVAGNGETSTDIAHGLRGLYSGNTTEPTAVGPTTTLAVFRALTALQPVALQGTFSALAWDDRGAISAGTLEVWCVDVVPGGAVYKSSGLTSELPRHAIQGENRVCPVPGEGTATMTAVGPAVPNTSSQPTDAGAPDPNMQMENEVDPAGPDAGSLEPRPDAGMPRGPRMQMPPGQRGVPCGTDTCMRSQREYCCIEAILGEAGAPQSSMRCATGPSACVATLNCSSDRECDPGQVCCMDAQRRSQCRAANSCAGDLHLACDTPDDCAPGQVCCALGMNAEAPRATACTMQCGSGYPGLVCLGDDHCPGMTECRESRALPSMNVCY